MKSVIMKLREKTKTYLSPKHQLYTYDIKFREYYAAAILLQTQLSQEITPMDHFELLRLFTFGLHLGKEEVKEVIKLSRNKQDVLERVLEMLNTPRLINVFLLDLYNMSCLGAIFGEKEEQAIDIYGELFHVQKAELRLMKELITAAYAQDVNGCMNAYSNMIQGKMDITLENIRYYIPELNYTAVIDSSSMLPGQTITIDGNYILRDTLMIPKGCRVIIQNAQVMLHAPIIMDSGRLEILNSDLYWAEGDYNLMFTINDSTETIIRNSRFYCHNRCGVISQNAGYLDMYDATFYESNLRSAISFNGGEIVAVKCHFYGCYTSDYGSAMNVKSKKGMIAQCSFNDCMADYGGALYLESPVKVYDAVFRRCHARHLGNSVYYKGSAQEHVARSLFEGTEDERKEIVQIFENMSELDELTEIKCSTYLAGAEQLQFDKHLYIHDVHLYLGYTLSLSGGMVMEHCVVTPYDFQGSDLVKATNGSPLEIRNSIFDGRGQYSGIEATGTKVSVYSSTFQNTANGRAIYNSVDLLCEDSVFSNCDDGAIYGSRAVIRESLFVNCRADRGAGCYLARSKGLIKGCQFERCVAMISDGAISKFGNYQIEKCTFTECEPDSGR